MSNPAELPLIRDVVSGLNCPFAAMAIQMSLYSLSIFCPALLLKSAGIWRPSELGVFPLALRHGSGQLYCLQRSTPVLLNHLPPEYQQVAAFDELSAVYEVYVTSFTQPIINEALNTIAPLLSRDTRLLDLSCGPGREIGRLARIVPNGEIVGVDLSAGMIKTAYQNAKDLGLTNVAFFQADVSAMPRHFSDRFDAILCSLAFHHYPRPISAANEMRRVLTSHGVALIIDVGTNWFKRLAEPFAAWADPGWVAFYSAEDFHRIFIGAGFSEFYWTEVLPGIGLAIATK